MKNKILLILICCVTLLSGCGKAAKAPVNSGNTLDSTKQAKTETNLRHVTRSGGGVSVCSSKLGTYYQSTTGGAIGYYDEKTKLSTALPYVTALNVPTQIKAVQPTLNHRCILFL